MCVQTTIAKHKERQDTLDYYRHVMRNDKLGWRRTLYENISMEDHWKHEEEDGLKTAWNGCDKD